MESHLKAYKELIKEVVSEWAATGQTGTTPVKTLVSFDDEHRNYLMLVAGWERGKRHHDIIFHAHLFEYKIWTRWDGTSPSISEELIRRGIPEGEIVFNWQSPHVRALKAAQAAETQPA